jgi:hypothetical protein
LVRRDAQEAKEAYYSKWLSDKVLGCLTMSELEAQALELTLSFTVLVDDGNLPCALTMAALDLLRQSEFLRDDLVFSVTVMQS